MISSQMTKQSPTLKTALGAQLTGQPESIPEPPPLHCVKNVYTAPRFRVRPGSAIFLLLPPCKDFYHTRGSFLTHTPTLALKKNITQATPFHSHTTTLIQKKKLRLLNYLLTPYRFAKSPPMQTTVIFPYPAHENRVTQISFRTEGRL